jgi:predicted TIM-barrel fold metal-dependent hydrolase
VIDGIRLIDAHVHAARLPTLKPAWKEWASRHAREFDLDALYDEEGTLVPERFHAHLEEQAVDLAILLPEYSPRATGIQPIEDLLPLVEHDPARARIFANVNPHLHHPIDEELARQLELGAVGMKVHPVHGGFPPNARELYPAYALSRERGIPVVFHCGTSVFPGATDRYADPGLIHDVVRDFPGLTVVLAHGGRGWWYDAAAFLTLAHEEVWIEISGLPPRRLPEYYARFDFERLARRFIFGTDWPGVPSIRSNAIAVAELGLDRETLELVLSGNAERVYALASQ